jgi:ABC-type bacteriocin/lantibiotic exporter with double-glycine peptidase domain
MMKSEVTFVDVNAIGGILTSLSEDRQLVQASFGTTKGLQIQNLGQFLAGILAAYVYNWRIALIATATIPLIFFSVFILVPAILKRSASKFQHVGASTTIAEEALSAIRTVKTFNREEREIERFVTECEAGVRDETLIEFRRAIGMTVIMTIIWGASIGNLYYGAHQVVDGYLEVGKLLSVFGFTLI